VRRLLGRLLGNTPDTLDAALWQTVRSSVRWVSRLDADRDARLQVLTARFLHDKAITPVAGLALDDEQRAVLAALCCLPLIEFGTEGLHGWSQLIVYPEAFRARHSHLDAAGVLHQSDQDLIGESWDHGPLILSWGDIEGELEAPDAGFCVAVHEMAHKLDALDGVLDGTPPLPRQWQREWARDFQAAYDRFVDEVGSGRETAIDPYAAEAPEEFFAVCSEYHFSDPVTLQRELQDVAVHLARFYGPSPFAT
jgi:Mlc titration factor MtfA (ptsG expression regulator)